MVQLVFEKHSREIKQRAAALARDGAGRKAGTRNKRTTAVIETVRANGQLPHEFLCAISQGKEIDTPTFAEQLEAAKTAAPFYAPKLANIDQNLSGHVGYIAIPVEQRDSDPYHR